MSLHQHSFVQFAGDDSFGCGFMEPGVTRPVRCADIPGHHPCLVASYGKCQIGDAWWRWHRCISSLGHDGAHKCSCAHRWEAA